MSDHDGKSKTASAVDQKHYPEQNEVSNPRWNLRNFPTHRQIEQRAHELWKARGCPRGSPEVDWFRAEEELRAAIKSANAIEGTARRGGSVQP